MSIVLYRIDDRLVHGQVMTAWSKIYKTNQIWVVDNETASNSFLCDVMKMSVPSEYEVTIMTTAQAVENALHNVPDQPVMVLMKSPAAARTLVEGGVHIPELNVGNIGAGPGRRAAMRNIQLSDEELDMLKDIAARGVRVYLQIFPDGKSIELDKIRLQ